MEKGNKDCPGEKRVTHEANHVVKQQKLLLKKKEREFKTLPANCYWQKTYSVLAEISTLSSFSTNGGWHFMSQQCLFKSDSLYQH